jgi:anti-sigma B factor antagonist
MPVESRTDAGHAVLALSGETDVSDLGALIREIDRAFEDSEVESLELDLADVTFMDSSGLGALVHAHKCSDTTGTPMFLRSPPEAVMRLLDIVGLTDLFTIHH